MNNLSSMNVLAVCMTSRASGGERGKIWAFGRGLVESSMLGYLGLLCEYPYAVDEDMNMESPCGIRKGSFAAESMHLTGEFDEFNESSGGTRITLFDGYFDGVNHVFVDTAGPAIPDHLYTRPPAAELYPNLPFRLLRNDGWVIRVWRCSHFEVLEYPKPDQEDQHIFYDPVAEQMTGLIRLYRIRSLRTSSEAHDKYCGFRYIPSEPTDPGEIVYFVFPMFPFKDSLIRETAKVVLSDWFGLPDPDQYSAVVNAVGLDGAR